MFDIIISVIFYLLMFALSIVTLVFAVKLINYSHEYPTYFIRNDTIIDKYNYNKTTYQNFLTGVEFYSYYYPNYDNYGLTGEQTEKCYLGSCYSKRELTSKDCSDACAITFPTCEADNEKCNNIYCEIIYYRHPNSSCHYYNEIKYWRGLQMNLTKSNFSFAQLQDVVE